MIIDDNFKYKDLIMQIEVLKCHYTDILTSFSWKDLKKKNDFIQTTKRCVYALNFEDWKKDKIWEYLNGDEELDTLKKFM